MNEDILKLLQELVAIKSVANNPEGLAESISFAEKYFAIPELKTEKFVKNGKENLLVAPANKTDRKFDVILNAHLDVVPAEEAMFEMKVKNGKAHGRGVFDMKGGGAVLMKLYKDLAQEKKLGNVALMLVTDEEIGGHDGVKPLLEEEKITCNFFIAGEPTDFTICYQQKGVLWLELVEKGKAAHGSRPWEGKNANISLAQKITKFYAEVPQPTSKQDWKTSYTLSILRGGGEAKNVVAEKAVAYMDVRRIQSESTESIIKNMQKIFTDTEINIFIDEPCLDTNPKDKYIQLLSQAIEKERKEETVLTRETFGSDSRFYSAVGVPAVNFGPLGGDMHGPNEWVDINSLDQYYTIVKDFLLSL